MREHFLQSKHFTDIPPTDHCQLPWSQDKPPQEPQLRNLLAGWDSEAGFCHLHTGFPSLFPICKMGRGSPLLTRRKCKDDCDKVPA